MTLGTTVQRYGLPLVFSKYKKWKIGLLKRVFAGSNELLIATLNEDRTEYFLDEKAAAEKTQGSHSIQNFSLLYRARRGNLGTSDCELERYIYNVYDRASSKWHETIELKGTKHPLDDKWSPDAVKLCRRNKVNSFRKDENEIFKGAF